MPALNVKTKEPFGGTILFLVTIGMRNHGKENSSRANILVEIRRNQLARQRFHLHRLDTHAGRNM